MDPALPENSCCGPEVPDSEEHDAMEAAMEQNLELERIASDDSMDPALPENSCCGPEVRDSEEQDAMEAAMEQNLEPELIASDEADVAAGATLCQNEWMMFLQGLISTNPMVAEAVHAQMNAIMVHRQESGHATGPLWPSVAAAAMAHANQNLELAEGMRQRAINEAECKMQEALASIEAAEQALGRDDEVLQAARFKLKEHTEPFATGAVDALRLIQRLLPFCHASAAPAIKKAERNVRDLVMLRCITCCQYPKNRDHFLVIACNAYEGDLDKESRAALLLSYHKNATNKQNGFTSNNQVAADRRGGPRPRKRRHNEQAGSGACSSHQQPSYEQPEEDNEEFIDVGDEGVMSSCCAAAAGEPMFLPLPEGYEESDSIDIFGGGFCLVPSDVLAASGWTPEDQEAHSVMTSSCPAQAPAYDCLGPEVGTHAGDMQHVIVTNPETQHTEVAWVIIMPGPHGAIVAPSRPTTPGKK